MKDIIWYDSELNNYESTWSLVNKFVMQNYINSQKEIFDYLTSKKNVRHLGVYTYPPNLIHEEYNYILELPKLIKHNKLYLSYLKTYCFLTFRTDYGNIANNKKALAELIYTSFRYCSECIKEGFHNPAFQMRWLSHCPIHLSPLTSFCPYCNKEIKYNINSHVINSPYACSCGYVYSSQENEYNLRNDYIKLVKNKIDSFIDWKYTIAKEPILIYRRSMG